MKQVVLLQRTEPKKFIEFIRQLSFIIGILAFLFSSAALIKYYITDQYRFNNNVEELKKIKNNSAKGENDKLKELLSLSSDIKGWISINDTKIDYPVLQSPMDSPIFYLDHDYKKNQSKSGSIFINSYYEMFDENTQNTVIHGHSMRNGTMFAALLKYSELNFLKDHYIVNFDSIYEKGKWKIFGIVKTNSDEKHGPIFDYFSPKFNSNEDFFNLIYNIKIRSIFNIPVGISSNDKIISLSTCSYEMEGFRTVIFARKIRCNESEEIDLNETKINPSPLMPEGWYKSRKLNAPIFETFDEALANGRIDWINT